MLLAEVFEEVGGSYDISTQTANAALGLGVLA
jgi:hypothetical protein